MTRRCFAVLLSALVAIGGLAAVADEPPPDSGDAPLRLKKKPKPDDNKPEPPKSGDKKPESKTPGDKKSEEKKDDAKEEPGPTAPQQDEKEVIERIARNMQSVDDRLAKGELNDATRQLQDDILKDIESLIRMSENPSQGGGGGGQQDQNQGEQKNQDQNPDNGKDNKGSQGSKQGKQDSGKGERGGQQSRGDGTSGPGTPGQGQSSGERQTGQSKGRGKQRQRGQLARGKQRGGQRPGNGNHMPRGNDPPGTDTADGKDPSSGNDKGKSRAELMRNADLDKQDVWGHLPESMRATMNAYAGRQEFMAKHEALIKKYYSTIATEGRRKGDQP